MQNRTLLIRYDEIGLKGRNRRHFENQLVRNIRNSLKRIKNIHFQKMIDLRLRKKSKILYLYFLRYEDVFYNIP